MNNYVLRDYQEEAVDKSVAFLKSPSKDNGIVIVPTGGGKSLIISNIAKRLAEPLIVLQPSLEILQQNHEKYTSYGFSAGIYSASAKQKTVEAVTFVTIGSVKAKSDLFKHVRYALLDESHLVDPDGSMYAKFIQELGVKVLGFTASPYRLNVDGFGGPMLKFITRTRPRIFSKVVYCVQNGDLFERGYLCPLKYLSIPGFDRTKIKLNTNRTDYDEESLQRYLNNIHFPDKIVQVVRKLLEVGRKRVLIFTRFISEAQYIASQIPGARVVTGKTPKKERAAIIKGFKDGTIPAIANVGTMTIGIDIPELDSILMTRPTLSLALWYQIVGRGVRIHPNKEFCMIIDMCENLPLFGKVEDLTIEDEGNEKWVVTSKGKKLTNVYYGT